MIQFCYFRLNLGIDTVSCFLLPVATDGHGLELKNIGPTLSSFNAMPVKITKTIITLRAL